jgi:hypothetical protein
MLQLFDMIDQLALMVTALFKPVEHPADERVASSPF